ncbi:MAG: PD-(D/E)XK nuclease family protein [Chloroflexi bacterium]|nr:PD-(D/E)XK nuclease family protein [Chloroflexota bacterium]
MASLYLVPYGPPARVALRDAIVDAKGGDPLAPVTVAVPSNYAGLSLRRSLGQGDLSLAAVSGRDGLVNVRFLVLARVAELLGAPALAAEGRRPLTGPVGAEAIRAALASDPGVFRDVAEHPATERSLDATFRDLRQAPASALDTVARRSDRAADVVRLFREVRRQTTAYYDEEQLAQAAAEAVRTGAPALRDVGHVILHLPRRLSPAEQSLIEALAEAGGLTAIVGCTGDAEADDLARRLASRLERSLGPAEEAPSDTIAAGTQIVAVTDAEEEVRSALRFVMARLAGGTPLHRMAVLYPITQPYALLAHEQFRAAGTPHNGPAPRTLAQTLSGRTLLGLLRLRDADFRRDALMDWLSAAPVLEQPAGGHAPAQRWDALSRSAGIVAGAAQWRERLARHRRSLAERQAFLKKRDDSSAWQRGRVDADLGHLDRLAHFVDGLTTALAPGGRSTWKQFAAWAHGLLERYLGREGPWHDLPEKERDRAIEAHRAVEAVVDALAHLGDVSSTTDEARFRRALERELEAPASRIGSFGEGVFIGRIADATGGDFDVVFLLGMTEGVIPSRGRDDPLLPDRERSVAGDELPLRTNRQAEERRDYLAAIASAPERVLVFPRSDLRAQRGHLPARWLLETASRLEGRTMFSTDLQALPPRPWLTTVPSFESALAGEGEAASAQEYDLRSLLHWRQSGKPATEHYLAAETPPLRNGLSATLARQSRELTRWDGRIDAAEGLAPAADHAVSATALQHWAACPLRYFLGHVLRVAETERPEDTLRLSPLERGNLVHRALEQFVREQAPRDRPDQPWSDEERAQMDQIGQRLCDAAEAAGLTGRPLLWQLERERVLRDLHGFLDADEKLRAEHGVLTEEMELSFGVADARQPALIVALADGRTVAFRGRIDRVDRAPDGGRLLVLDYKTGSAAYTNVDKDPVQRGQLLQLPIYALAARDAYGDVPVDSYYWFVTEQADYERKGYAIDADNVARFQHALTVITDGIGGGLFPARPGERRSEGFENCQICPYDRVCPRDRISVWRRKRWAPPLRDYLDLAEPES